MEPVIELDDIPMQAFFVVVAEPEFGIDHAVGSGHGITFVAVVVGDALECYSGGCIVIHADRVANDEHARELRVIDFTRVIEDGDVHTIDGKAALDVFAVDGGFPKSGSEIGRCEGNVDEDLCVALAESDGDFLAFDKDFSATWCGSWIGREHSLDALQVGGNSFGLFRAHACGGEARFEGLACLEGFDVGGIETLEGGDIRANGVGKVGAFDDLRDGGLIGPVHGETRFSDIGLRGEFGGFEQFEGLVFQIEFEDISGGIIERGSLRKCGDGREQRGDGDGERFADRCGEAHEKISE